MNPLVELLVAVMSTVTTALAAAGVNYLRKISQHTEDNTRLIRGDEQGAWPGLLDLVQEHRDALEEEDLV